MSEPPHRVVKPQLQSMHAASSQEKKRTLVLALSPVFHTSACKAMYSEGIYSRTNIIWAIICYGTTGKIHYLSGTPLWRGVRKCTWKHMCIAHCIANVVVEEDKKGRKPRPNKLHTSIEHKQTNIKWVGHSGAQPWELGRWVKDLLWLTNSVHQQLMMKLDNPMMPGQVHVYQLNRWSHSRQSERKELNCPEEDLNCISSWHGRRSTH